ncbi:MAG: VWA domain-containing protein [Sedimentisphaerales bacterium]|nr:VWA domain-containing protein [Sedimentisphaerales bacterium]
MLGNVKALWLIFLVPAVLVPAYIWAFLGRARALRQFADVPLLGQINGQVSRPRQVIKAVILMGAFVCIVVALARPRWNPRPQVVSGQGRDICILLDTSKSMLAQDIRPNRLERAKSAIKDLLDQLDGDRIAIVTFAGNAAIKCPLTQDYAFVRMILATIDTESNSRGGTMIGDAIRLATTEIFDQTSRQYKDIILITDGEDHGSFAEQAAEKAGQEGIRIIAIGLGDDQQGARVPIVSEDGTRRFLTYKGQEHWSKLDSDLLRRIAFASQEGKYLLVRPGTTLDLGRVYKDLIATAPRRRLESATMMTYDERFQVFLGLAIILLVAEGLIAERN